MVFLDSIEAASIEYGLFHVNTPLRNQQNSSSAQSLAEVADNLLGHLGKPFLNIGSH